MGDRGTRIWILDRRSGKVWPLLPQDRGPIQVHSAWTPDGKAVLYHGPAKEGGWYIGAVSREGATIREWTFRGAQSYGHVSTDAMRPAIILDGNLTSDMLLWLYYDRAEPRIEMIARHGTNWNCIPYQYTHPHPQADPTGRWISFNAATRPGRTDVFVVDVSKAPR